MEKSRGKGGHKIIRTDGGRWTTVKTGELGKGLKDAMLEDQLGWPKDAF